MKKNYLISIVIPVFDEAKTIKFVLNKVKKTNLKKEIIVVNDGSKDASRKILSEEKNIILINLKKNHGKGFALKQGIKKASGDIVITQDADLEYDPSDYKNLIEPIILKKAKVVFGSRFMNSKDGMFFTQRLANKILTYLTNLLYASSLSDMETGYKVFKKEIIKKINWQANRFNFEPEITAKILKKGIKIYEVPIVFKGRKYKEGKKINWIDAIVAIKTLFWYKFFN